MNNHKWTQVLQQAPMGMIILSVQGNVLHCNPTSENFWGSNICCQPGSNILQLMGTTLPDLLHFLEHQPQFVQTVHLTHEDTAHHSATWATFTASAIRDDDGHISELLICHIDISDETYSRQAIENTALGVTSVGEQNFFDGLVVHLARIFDARYAFIGLLSPDQTSREITTLSLCADGNVIDNITYALKDTPCDGVLGQEICAYPCDVQSLFPNDSLLQDMAIEGYIGAPIFDPAGSAIGIMVILDTKPLERVGQVSSILEIFAARAGAEIQRLDAEQRVHRLAYQDILTDLPNRARLQQYMRELLRQSGPHDRARGALLMLDLDHFKTVNDALGHDVGDAVINLAGQRLRQHLPADTFLARIGGDEFVVVQDGGSEGINPADIENLSAELGELLSQPFRIGDRILNIGASIGIVYYPEGCQSAAHPELELMRRADIALYQAKNAGRDQSVIFSPEHQQAVNLRMEIERGLREALNSDQLKIFMQPQVNPSGKMVGAEVLLRWEHPEKGMIPPFHFIPIAEETGLILKLGQWVLDKTLQQIAEWYRQELPVPPHISVNVSAWQFAQTDFAQQMTALCQKWQIETSRIVLELTETALLRDIDEARQKLSDLREQGFRVSLDDFGTGYSSLAYLRDLPLDELKIDKSFIDEVQAGNPQPLVQAMIAIGKHMELDVVAEGVETGEQADLLYKMGCHIYQGYHFARPMPAQQIPFWSEQQTSQV